MIMRGKAIFVGLVLSLSGAVASAQGNVNPNIAAPNDLYCSGVVTTESVPRDTFVITGEESNIRIIFNEGDNVFVNKGASGGVKVGDEFFVVRKVTDPGGIEWTKWQNSIMRKMGSVWEDEGRLKVISVRQDTSIAIIEHACSYVQRGDTVLPFTERPAPPFKTDNNFDHFLPADGKALAMVVTGKNFQQQVGREDIIYVNLGNAQGVKVGDYFRIFRYQGTQNETAYQTPRYAFDQEFGSAVWEIKGFGSVPSKYKWDNVPREDIGEGIVLRTGPDSATVLITLSLREIYAGDYVELE
jgi:hypothetical protein